MTTNNKIHDLFGTFPSFDPKAAADTREKVKSEAIEIAKALETPGGKLILAQLEAVYAALNFSPEEFIQDGVVNAHRLSEVVGQRTAFQTMISWLDGRRKYVERLAEQNQKAEMKSDSV